MKFYDKVLKSKFNNNVNEKHIGLQYQPVIYNNPIITTNSAPITLKPLSDVEGLQRAYARTNGVYVRNNTMFVAGSKDLNAWYDDFTKIPFNKTHNSLRYINADKALKQNDADNPNNKITSIVGHSLGGSVVLDMQKQKQNPDITFKTTTYGAPVASLTVPDNINNKRYRNYDDAISMFDRGSTTSVKTPLTIENYLNIKSPSNISEVATKLLDNHSYDNFTNNKIDNTSQDTYVYKTDE